MADPPFHAVELEFTLKLDSEQHTTVTAISRYPEGSVKRFYEVDSESGSVVIDTRYETNPDDEESCRAMTEKLPLNTQPLPWDEPIGSELVRVYEDDPDVCIGASRFRDLVFDKQLSSQLQDFQRLDGAAELSPVSPSGSSEATQPPQSAHEDTVVYVRYEQIQGRWQVVVHVQSDGVEYISRYEIQENQLRQILNEDSVQNQWSVTENMIELRDGRIGGRVIGGSNVCVSPSRFIWYHVFEDFVSRTPHESENPSVPYPKLRTLFSN